MTVENQHDRDTKCNKRWEEGEKRGRPGDIGLGDHIGDFGLSVTEAFYPSASGSDSLNSPQLPNHWTSWGIEFQ